MKLHLTIVFFLAVASLAFEQTPSPSPKPTQSASPEKTRAKTFGSSLQKYKPKELRDFHDRPKSNGPDDVETIRVTTDLVVNDVLVKDQNGKMVTELNKEDFVVTEDGAPQKIEVFSSGESLSVPRSMVLIIDCHFLQAPYLKNSIQAAKMLVDRLAPQDKMAIVTVDVKLVVDFTADKTLLKNKLSSLLKDPILESRKELEALLPQIKDDPRLSKGVWDIWEKYIGPGREFEALLAVLNEMFDREDRQRIVIFQGDGNEIMQLKPDKDTSHQIASSAGEEARTRFNREKAAKNFEFSDIKEAIERSRATIYSVAPGIRFLGLSNEEQKARAEFALTNLYRAVGGRGEAPARLLELCQSPIAELLLAGQTAMFRIAELSGGNLDFIEKPEDAEGVYSNIFKLISNRYLIGYYPTNQGRDRKRREIKVEVRNHPEYIVTGRKAYFPQ
ncbi:MAG TPA: VWA domain-containing protein [Pyrinomonadaceae bacterium]|nr:VWA domain-containing protein [Pyrinomonadaceae bacterium]